MPKHTAATGANLFPFLLLLSQFTIFFSIFFENGSQAAFLPDKNKSTKQHDCS